MQTMSHSFYQARQKCYRKSRFALEKTAKKKVNTIKYEGGPQLYVYCCTSCGGYHLTKNPEASGQVL